MTTVARQPFFEIAAVLSSPTFAVQKAVYSCACSHLPFPSSLDSSKMREIVHLQAGQCGNQIGAKVSRRRAALQPYSCKCVAGCLATLFFATVHRLPPSLPPISAVLGSYLRRARHRPDRYLSWRLRPSAGEDKCLLQRGYRWKVRSEGRSG